MSMPDTAPQPATQPLAVVPDDATEEPKAEGRDGESPASDIVEIWGLGSFPASDPPSNW